jgi:hypothetical protein
VRPIVHIGVHKTATGWFQKKVYPTAKSHRAIDRTRVRAALIEPRAFAFDAEAARSALGVGDDGRPHLLCEEDLSGVLHIGRASGFIAKEMAERIRLLYPDARIVLFVRAQPAIALSSYQEYVREGGTHSLKRYLFPDAFLPFQKHRPFKLPRFDFAQFDYRGLIEHYDRLFGRENVHLFAYEQLAADPRGLLGKMSARLELDLGLAAISWARVNPSYRGALIPIARALNLFTARSVADKRTLIHLPFSYPLRKELIAALNRLPVWGGPPQLNPQIMAWIAGRFWQSNRWLAERMGSDLAALAYPMEPPAGPVADPVGPRLPGWLRI